MKRFFPIVLAVILISAVTFNLSGCGGGKHNNGGSNDNNDGDSPTQTPLSTQTYNIYVADTNNGRIVGMDDMDGTNWTAFGTEGDGVNQFASPSSVFVGSDNKIYVADTYNHRIVRMDYLSGIGWTAFGTKGSGDNQFQYPSSVFVTNDGKIYVCDANNKRIVCMDDMKGNGWKTLGKPGNMGDDGVLFFGPQSIFVDNSGEIYVTDFKTGYFSQIVRTKMDGTGWTTLMISQADESGRGFTIPWSVFVGSGGKIYVAESEIPRIECMDDMNGKNRTTLTEITGDSFSFPSSVFVGSDGKIYMTDGGTNERIVRMDDMNGTGWKTFGASGKGSKQFWGPSSIFVK